MPNANPILIENAERLRQLHGLKLLDAPPDPTFDRLTRLAARLLNVPISIVSLVDAHRQYFQSAVGMGDPINPRETDLAHSYCQHVVATDAPLIVNDARTHPLLQDSPSIVDLNAVAYAGIPLRTPSGATIGSFCVIDKHARQWTPEEISTLDDLAHLAMTELELRGELIEKEIIEAALNSRINQLQMLRRIDGELSDSLDMNSVLQIALDAAARASNAENIAIGLLEGDLLVCAAAVGGYPVGTVWNKDSGLTGRSLRRMESQLVLNVKEDPDYRALIPETQAQMNIPLLYRDRLIGVIQLETARPSRFSEDAFTFLKLIAARVAAAIDNAQLFQVSQQRLAELRQLYDRLRELEQLKSDMIRIAAHDLRNPLNTIMGYAYLLLENKLTDGTDPMQFLRNIREAAQKMNTIIGDILSLERIEAMAANAHMQRFNLSDLIARSYGANEETAKAKRQTLTLKVEEPDLMVQGDEAQVREAIDNLIGNAIKYTPDGGSIKVRGWQESGGALFEVEDTGYGIPESMHARLFQPFFRAITDETEKIQGTGLGLHLVKNIIVRHHGQMRFHSEYGKGSKFGFRLPVTL